MSDVGKYLLWSGFGGLSLAISIANGVDITTEGILAVIAKGILPFAIAVIFNLLLLALGFFSTYKEVESFLEEETEIVVLGISCFLAMFLLYIGTDLKVDWIQNLGVIPLLTVIGTLIYIKKTS